MEIDYKEDPIWAAWSRNYDKYRRAGVVYPVLFEQYLATANADAQRRGFKDAYQEYYHNLEESMKAHNDNDAHGKNDGIGEK